MTKPLVPAFMDVIERRSKAVESLLHSLKHLPTSRQFEILTSYMPIDELERLAQAQIRGDK